ncbi:hypothetical protein GCM10027516_10360 [Niabella aquatica]
MKAQGFPNPIKSNLSIKAGAESRRTNFRWSIAGNTAGQDPNIYSELIYNPVHSAGFFVGAHYTIYKRWTIEANYNRLSTYKGSATDIDYAGDNRTQPIKPLIGDTLFRSDKGHMSCFNMALSYTFIDKQPFKLSAGAGYTNNRELFYLLDDEMPDLNTTYRASWKGALFFLEGMIHITPQVYIQPRVSFQPMQYNSTANWNIQEDFQHPVSFIQTANGTGWNYTAHAGYRLNKNMGLHIEWLYADWKTKKGIDHLYRKSGEIPVTQMNGAFKKSSGWRLSATYSF